MIPYRDNVQSRSFPFVNVTIIVINLVVFLYEVALSQDTIRGSITELDRFIFEWGNIPACTFDALGQGSLSVRGDAVCADQREPLLTIVTAMFMHAGWLHILGNMLFLWIFGDNVEDTVGHARYAIFYLLAGILAALSHGILNVDSLTPAIGASGAIAGVMGAYIVLFPRATVFVLIPFIFFVPMPVPAMVLIGFWFVIQLFSGFAALGVDAVGGEGGVAYFAHIGGFIAGAILVNLFAIPSRRRRNAIPARRR